MSDIQELAEKLDARGFKPRSLYSHLLEKIPPKNWMEEVNNPVRGLKNLMEDLLLLKTPYLWNAFIQLGGQVNLNASRNDEELDAVGGFFSSVDKKSNDFSYEPNIDYQDNSDHVTFIHELGHFIDDAAPFLCKPGEERYKCNMGFHHGNKLWQLISYANQELRHIESGHIENKIAHYEDSDQSEEYFAWCIELHASDAEKEINLSPVTKKYVKSIVEFDALLCCQDKELEQILADRAQFKTMVNNAIDVDFKNQVEQAARDHLAKAAEQLISKKITTIMQEARKVFRVNAKPARE